MPEKTPAERHAEKLLDKEMGAKMLQSTTALEEASIRALKEFFKQFRDKPEEMLAQSSATGGPQLHQNMVAAIFIQFPFPLTDTSPLQPTVASSAKYEQFNPYHVSFQWKEPRKSE